VPPEEYMELWRRVLFFTFAIISYVYRWWITFKILSYFIDFLKPHGLEVIGQMLVFASLGSMVGWPLYRLGKSLHRRGRLPDMKRWRVITSTSVLAALILFVCFVPVRIGPIGRIWEAGVVEAQRDAKVSVYVKYPGQLTKLLVRPGQKV